MPITELEQLRRDLTLIQQRIGAAEVDLERSRRNKRTDLPQIIRAGAPCVWKEDWGCWFLHFPIRTAIKEVWWYEKVYEIPQRLQRPFSISLYMPVREDAKVRLDRVCTLGNFALPHVDSSSACMKSEAAPKSLTSLADYKALHAILIRHTEGIQLASLFSNWSEWPQAEVFEVLPEEVQDWLRSDGEDPELKDAMSYLFKNPGTDWLSSAKSEPTEEFQAEPPQAEPDELDDPPGEDAQVNEIDLPVPECGCEACRAARAALEAARQIPQFTEAQPTEVNQIAIGRWVLDVPASQLDQQVTANELWQTEG